MADGKITPDELRIGDRLLVETDLGEHPVSFRAVIVKISPTELWLGLSSLDRSLETLPADHPIRLMVPRGSSVLMGQSRFLRPLGSSRARAFAVGIPKVIEHVERRAHVRYDIQLPINFLHVDAITFETRGEGGEGVTVNLSSGGLLMRTDVALEPDDRLDLALLLSAEDRVRVLGVVTRVAAIDASPARANAPSNRPEAAVRFTHITAVDRDRILRLLVRVEHRREAS